MWKYPSVCVYVSVYVYIQVQASDRQTDSSGLLVMVQSQASAAAAAYLAGRMLHTPLAFVSLYVPAKYFCAHGVSVIPASGRLLMWIFPSCLSLHVLVVTFAGPTWDWGGGW